MTIGNGLSPDVRVRPNPRGLVPVLVPDVPVLSAVGVMAMHPTGRIHRAANLYHMLPEAIDDRLGPRHVASLAPPTHRY